MPKSRVPKSVRVRSAGRKARLAARLELPILDPVKLERLKSSKRRSRTIEELNAELQAFTAVSDAVRRSHRYYVDALHKVYETWIDLLAIADVQRDALISMLNERNSEKTKRGDALHVLLRALIDYRSGDREQLGDEAYKRARQAAWSRLSRDAAVLRNAERITLTPDAFVTHVLATPGGLDQMAKDEMKARVRERKTGAEPARNEGDRSPSTGARAAQREEPETSKFPHAHTPEPSVDPAGDSPPCLLGGQGQATPSPARWRYGKSLRRQMALATLANREVILRVFIGSDGRRTVRDAYQMSEPYVSDKAFAEHMEGIGARLIEKGRKRPKV